MIEPVSGAGGPAPTQPPQNDPSQRISFAMQFNLDLLGCYLSATGGNQHQKEGAQKLSGKMQMGQVSPAEAHTQLQTFFPNGAVPSLNENELLQGSLTLFEQTLYEQMKKGAMPAENESAIFNQSSELYDGVADGNVPAKQGWNALNGLIDRANQVLPTDQQIPHPPKGLLS